MFSVIVVSLNTKLDLIKTLNSIKKQKYQNYEIVIVDGKSEDGSIEEIKKRKNKKTKIIIEKDNGIYDAMNKGVKNANGKWIIFLNSGDIFYNSNILEKIYTKKLNKYDVLFGDTSVKTKFMNYKLQSKNFSKDTILMPFCHQSTIVKNQILKRYNFSRKYNISSDFNFFLKIFHKKHSFYKLDFIISRITSNGISDSNRTEVYNENIKIIKSYNYAFHHTLLLTLHKYFNFFKMLIKFIFPNFLKIFILKIKYRKFKF